MRDCPNLFFIPAGADFLPALGRALLNGTLWARAPDSSSESAATDSPSPAASLAVLPPEILPKIRVYLPTRRACAAFPGILQQLRGGAPGLMPSIRALGDPALEDEDNGGSDPDTQDVEGPPLVPDSDLSALDPPIGSAARHIHLTRLLMEAVKDRAADSSALSPTPRDAAWLAGDLARLMNEMATAGLGWEALMRLDAGEHADYWQMTLDFLKVAARSWPAFLAALGRSDPVAWKLELLHREAAYVRTAPPDAYFVVAGSTGSVPATAQLMKAVLAHRRGALVLPGLEQDMDETVWQAIGAHKPEGERRASAFGHPQFAMQALLASLGVARDAVRCLPGAGVTAEIAGRMKIVNAAMRPASVLHEPVVIKGDGAKGDGAPSALAAGFARCSLVEAGREEEEARAIAIIVREAFAMSRRVALVTPDRDLARRVIVELQRWKIMAVDSAGQALERTVTGRLALHVAMIFSAGQADPARGAPLPAAGGAGAALYGDPHLLIALLASPLAALGAGREFVIRAARDLERGVLRGLLTPADLADFRGFVAQMAKAGGRAGRHTPRACLPDKKAWADVARLLDLVDACLDTVPGDYARRPLALSHWLCLHREILRRLCAQTPFSGPAPALPGGHGGIVEARFADWIEAGDGLPMSAFDYAEVFRALLAGVVVPARRHHDMRLHISAPLEARLIHADVTILSGLNETIWPRTARRDPWLNRSLRQAISLPPPERLTGASAHDFVQLLGSPAVVLTRSRQAGGGPAMASRWLQRLVAFLGGDVTGQMRARGQRYLDLARKIDDTPAVPAATPSAASAFPADTAWSTGASSARPASAGPARPLAHGQRPNPVPPLAVRPRRFALTSIQKLVEDPYAIYVRRILRLQTLDLVARPPNLADRGNLFHACLAEFLDGGRDRFDDAACADFLRIGQARFAPLMAFRDVRLFWWPQFERVARAFVAMMDEETANRPGTTRWTEIEGAACFGDIGQGERLAHEDGAQPGSTCADGADPSAWRMTGRLDRLDLAPQGGTIFDYKTGEVPGRKDVERLRAPQLPLAAALLRAGGFSGIDRKAPLDRLSYIKIQPSDPFVKLHEVAQNADEVEKLAKQASEALHALRTAFDDPARGYLSCARSGITDTDRAADEVHLARVKEWCPGGVAASRRKRGAR